MAKIFLTTPLFPLFYNLGFLRNINVKKSFFLFICVLSFSKLWSQEKFTSKVRSSDGETLWFAHVIAYSDSLYREPFYNSQLEDDKIQFQVPDTLNCFYLRISHLNYHSFQKKICRPFRQTDTIALYKKMNELDEVVVDGFKETKISITGNVAEIRPGRILQAGKGVYVANIIKSIPEVFVLPENEISIRGRKVQHIYLHTSPNAPGINISPERLQGISAGKIQKVTAFYNEAELHVYLKEMKEAGYASDNQLKLNYGKKFYTSLSPDFTFNKGKTTFWLDLQIGYNAQNFASRGTYDVDIGETMPQSLISKSNTDQMTRYFKSYLMMEHKFDSIYTTGVQLDYTIDKGSIASRTQSTIFDTGNAKTFTKDDNNSSFFTTSAYLKGMYASNWSFTLKSGFLTSLQKNRNRGVFNYRIDEQPMDGTQYLRQRNNTKVYINEFQLEKKLNTTTLTLEAQNDFLDTKVNSFVQQRLLDYEVPDSTFVNELNENKFTLQAKVNTMFFKKYILNFSSTLLLYHYEYTDADSGTLFQNNIETWLPSVSVSIPLKDAKYLTFFGNTTFRAPNLRNIVFDAVSSDGYVINKNNYALKPSLTYQVGTSFSPFKKISSSLYWSKTANMYMNYPSFSSDGAFEGNRKINLSKNNSLGLSLYYSNTFFDKIFLSSNASINYNSWENTGTYAYSTNFTSLLMNSSLYYTSTNNWSLRLDFTYSTLQKFSNEVAMKSWLQLNVGASKRINSHWSVFGNINNVLNTYNPSIYALSPEINYSSNIDFDTRYISIGINYEFEKQFENIDKETRFMQNSNNRVKIQK